MSTDVPGASDNTGLVPAQPATANSPIWLTKKFTLNAKTLFASGRQALFGYSARRHRGGQRQRKQRALHVTQPVSVELRA